MPLQNRVTPFGEIVALAGRGLMMGNRGVLHDDHQRIVRPYQVKRWIACRLEFRGRHRTVMQPHRYTELFFLDEATAFAAGHRPCAECRHEDYERFRSFWRKSHSGPTGADDMDARLHHDRLDGRRTKRVYQARLADLPDGAYVAIDGRPWLVWGDALFAWSADGYSERRERRTVRDVAVLTPKSAVEVLASGYRVDVHPAALG